LQLFVQLVFLSGFLFYVARDEVNELRKKQEINKQEIQLSIKRLQRGKKQETGNKEYCRIDLINLLTFVIFYLVSNFKIIDPQM